MEHEQDETEAAGSKGGFFSENCGECDDGGICFCAEYQRHKDRRALGDTFAILEKKGLGKKRYKDVKVDPELL